MYYLYWSLGLLGLGLGLAIALRRDLESPHRIGGVVLSVGGLLAIVYVTVWSSYGTARQYGAIVNRQGHALGYGIGQHLKQTQAGRRIAVLHITRGRGFESSAINGLKEGLGGASNIVLERFVDMSHATDYPTAGALLSTALLAELKAAGAEVVVSFAGLPMRVDSATVFDPRATLELWRTAEYRALQWVLPHPPEPWPKELFREGRVLAVVRAKPQLAKPGEDYPAFLNIKGTPAELFHAWFELVTTEPTQ